MEPLIAATTWEIEQLRRDLRAGLAAVPAAALNARLYPTGNTIAGLIAHMYDAGNFLLHTGLGEAVARDRDAQFAATVRDAADLLARVDRGTENLLALAARYTATDLARHQEYRGNTVAGAWFLVHACAHLAEHWGQIQTLRDLRGA